MGLRSEKISNYKSPRIGRNLRREKRQRIKLNARSAEIDDESNSDSDVEEEFKLELNIRLVDSQTRKDGEGNS
jgi:hypothetical protein